MANYAQTIMPEDELVRLKQLERIGQEFLTYLQKMYRGNIQDAPILVKSEYPLKRQSGISFAHPDFGIVAKVIYDTREHEQYKGPHIIVYGEGARQGSSIDSAVRSSLTNLRYNIIGIEGYCGDAVSYLAEENESRALSVDNMKAKFPNRNSERHGNRKK